MKVTRWIIGDLAGIVAACLLSCLVLLAVGAVIFRYVVGAPIAWTEEVQTLLLLWIIMIGMIYGKRKNLLLRMDIVYNMLPSGIRRGLAIFQELVNIILFCMMAYYGYKLALQVGAKLSSMLQIPLLWLYLSLPVGAVGALIITLLQLNELIRGREVE